MVYRDYVLQVLDPVSLDKPGRDRPTVRVEVCLQTLEAEKIDCPIQDESFWSTMMDVLFNRYTLADCFFENV